MAALAAIDGTLVGLAPGHWYPKQSGGYVPSVTTIIGRVLREPHLERWRGQVGNEKADRTRDEAAAFGTACHEVCGLAGEDEDIPLAIADPAVGIIGADYTRWFNSVVVDVAGVEVPFVNEAEGYAGTIDLIARLKGDAVFTVIDLKTAVKLGPGYKMQTAAYFEAAHRVLGIKVGRRLIVHADKKKARRGATGTIRTVEYTNHAGDYNAFLSALHLYRWLEGAA